MSPFNYKNYQEIEKFNWKLLKNKSLTTIILKYNNKIVWTMKGFIDYKNNN